MYSKRAYSTKAYIPKKKSVSFENGAREIKLPFIIYAHFESIQVQEGTKILHKPCGFGYSVKCSFDDSFSKYKQYLGEDSPRVLWEKLEAEVREITQILRKRAKPRVMNNAERKIVEKLNTCRFCRKELRGDRNEEYHPCTGDFLGVVHKDCSLKFTVPVVMYNFGKYGSHFLLKELTSKEMESVFLVGKDQGFQRKLPESLLLRFIDLKQFMDEKIEELEKILSDSKKLRLKSEFGKGDSLNLIKKKICFPVNYTDSFAKFLDRRLPGRDGFFDRLHEEDISEEAYQRSQQVWSTFKCQSLRDYFYLHVKSTVCLLEDIFENFRQLCLDKYSLDPAHYYTIASFSWDSMLRFTGVELELLQDQSMITLIKDNIRGGIVQCSKRHSKANNKFCPLYNTTKSPSFIVYLDANNLGGWAMSQNLPFSDFRWLTRSEIETVKHQISDFKDNDEYGYIFEVDLDYPKELHQLHNDLPFCSEHIKVSSGRNYNSTEKKPTLNLHNKKKYVIEYRTLKQCLKNGLILRHIHRVLEFKQCKWLEPYITYNTNLRAEAKNDFDVKLFKLLNNSVYGKTIQKTSTDKPIYAGFSILELSKKFMYDFHYGYMVPAYPNKINLLYFDTDGAIYEIHTNDYYRDLKANPSLLQMMDTSNLDGRWGIPQSNKKVVGKMKEEYGGQIIREFFGVGAKVYFLDVDGEEVKKAVGMKKYVKQKFISRDDYEKCVFDEKRITRSFFETSTENHVVTTKKSTKTVLSPGDWKRVVLSDKIKTLALGSQDS